MFAKVLVLLDGTDASEVVLQYVPSLVNSAGSKTVTLLTVSEGPSSEHAAELERYVHSKAEHMMDEAMASLHTLCCLQGSVVREQSRGVASTIVEYAAQHAMGLIMLATKGWSGSAWWAVGDVAQKVIRTASGPVYVVRPGRGRMPVPSRVERILVPLDGSSLAERTLPYAVVIAKTSSAAIDVLSVVEHEAADDHSDNQKYLMSIASKAEHAGNRVMTHIRHGVPGQQIASFAQEQGTDLIIMSSHGRSGPGGGAFGGVSEAVIHGCHVPIIVIPKNCSIAN